MISQFKISVGSILLGACILITAGCANSVRTTVSTYQGDVTLPQTATFFVAPQADKPEHFDELEFRYFADRLASQLKGLGMSEADPSVATHKVLLQYDSQRQEKESDRSRLHFHTGFGYTYRYGSVVVIDGNDYDRYEFARRIRISIEANTDAAEKVVSLSAVSYGRCEHLNAVFDEMITAILGNLDSKSGSVIPVKVRSQRACSGA